jgi:hypothetical protein
MWASALLLLLTGLVLGLLLAPFMEHWSVTLSEAPRSRILNPLHVWAARPARSTSSAANGGISGESSCAADKSPRGDGLQFRQSFGGLQHKRALSRASLLSGA